MNTGKQSKSGTDSHQENVRKSNAATIVTCFAILWTVCCLCMLLQSYLLDSHSYIPQEVVNAKQVEDLLDKSASRTIYAAFSFSSAVLATTQSSDQTPPSVNQIVQIPIDRCLIKQDEKYKEDTARLLLDYKEAVLRDHPFNLMKFIRSALMSAAILLCFGACLNCLKDNFFERSSRVSLCVIFVLLHLLMLVIAQYAFLKNSLGTSCHLNILLPLALFPALGAYLLGLRFGICISMLLSILTPVVIGGESPYTIFIYSIITSFSGLVLFHNVSKRNGFLLGGLYLSVILLLISLFFLWQSPIEGAWEEWSALFQTFRDQNVQTQWPHFWIRLVIMALANGFFVMIAMFVLSPICERFFDIITPIALHELDDTDHPLLSRLHDEAEGTYDHSVQVSELAKYAAEAIGADKLLAKVCGLFHDVGKLKNPEFFIENLIKGQHNPHSDLTPAESCAKIREHVIHGGELARKYKLQRPIVEAIVSHHGTDVIGYFYHKACQEAEANGTPMPDKQDFSYNGPLPHRKEVVIVEIADICEAASRAELPKWDHIDLAKVRDFIDKLIMNKMKNRQFDEADLTIGELNIVCDDIASSICRHYHDRPRYAQSQDDNNKRPHPLAAEHGTLTSTDLREIIHSADASDKDTKAPEIPPAPQEEQQQQVAHDEPQQQVAHDEPQQQVAHDEPQQQVAHDEPQQQVAHDEPQQQVAHDDPQQQETAQQETQQADTPAPKTESQPSDIPSSDEYPPR
ncbi:MAG: HDIG domain-containing protein [Lentisphaeria bacterium]|nr:HDIG domain-containing protein [Lentisphaeria bacterium]